MHFSTVILDLTTNPFIVTTLSLTILPTEIQWQQRDRQPNKQAHAFFTRTAFFSPSSSINKTKRRQRKKKDNRKISYQKFTSYNFFSSFFYHHNINNPVWFASQLQIIDNGSFTKRFRVHWYVLFVIISNWFTKLNVIGIKAILERKRKIVKRG